MDFADYIMVVLILGLGASVIFSVALQAVVTMVAVVYKPKPRTLSVRQHHYDFDQDEN